MKTDVLYVIATVGFFIWTIRSLFYWIQLWQRVRYQPSVFVKSPKARERIWDYLVSRSAVVTWIGILFAFYVTVEDFPELYYQLFVISIFLVKAGLVIREILIGKFTRPLLSVQSLSIIVFSLFVIILLFSFPLTEKFLWLLLLDRLVVFIISIFVFLFTFPSEIVEDYRLRKAGRRMKAMKNILSIGVIGGAEAEYYREVISKILDNKQNIASISSLDDQRTGFSEAILKEVTDETDIVVATLNPLDKYTFAIHLEILHPHFVVIPNTSSINKVQLLSILSTLPKKTRLFLDSSIRHYLTPKDIKGRKIIYFSDSSFSNAGKIEGETLKARQIVLKKQFLEFTAILPTGSQPVSAPLLGSFFVKPLLLSLYFADYIGYTKKDIASKLKQIDAIRETLSHHKLRGGITVIDDTGNSSNDIFESVLEYINIYHQKKILVLGQMDRLQDDKQVYQFGEKISSLFSHIFLYDFPMQHALKRGLREGTNNSRLIAADKKKIIESIRKLMKKGDIILFEGRTKEILKPFLGITEES